jgi:hypothetical protein
MNCVSYFDFLFISCAPNSTTSSSSIISEMISRRKILSRSKDALNCNDDQFNPYEEEEDIWFSKDKLFKVWTNFFCKMLSMI